MSSGLDCQFYHKNNGQQWFYDLLDNNHQNPGGYSVMALEGCKHENTETSYFGDTSCNDCDTWVEK